MQQPHVVWGVHVVQGAAIAVKLRRSEQSGLEIESAYVEENDGKMLPVHVASMLLARPGPKGEPAVVALPDATEFLATVRMRAEEAERSDDDLARALQNATHFEPGHEVLRSVHVMRDGDADVYLVAAHPKNAVAAAIHEFEHKAPLPAIAFGGAAVVRGAQALGISSDPCVLVEIEPHVTVAYFVDRGHVRRRSVPIGEREILKDDAECTKLAEELLRFADARAGTHHEGAGSSAEVPFVVVGPGAALDGVRQRLEPKLKGRLTSGTIGQASVRTAPGARLHHAPVAALAGAVGAALEPFAPLEERLLVRDLPADLSAPHDRSLAPWWVAAAAVAVVAIAAFELLTPGSAPEPANPKTNRAVAQAPAPAEPATPADAPRAGPVSPKPPAPPPQPAATVIPKVEVIGPGQVRVGWPAGREGRILRRFDAGWNDVATLGAAAGSLVDEVPGATQLYGWRIDDGEAAFARVEVPVDVEFLGPTDREGGKFELRRSWHGAPCSVTVDVAPGEPIRATASAGEPPVEVVLDSECWLVAVRSRRTAERETVRVPRFGPDGRVVRGPDDAAVLVEREIERAKASVEAETTTGGGAKRVFSLAGS